MADTHLGPGLRGRRNECEVLDGLVDSLRAGQSRVLCVRGEAGVGKTALLGYLRERASGCRVARASGVESEMELAFAGLHQLCGPLLGGLERLPDPQRDALRAAFGLSAGDAPDRFLVGLAVMGLLSDAAEERPLVCVVDDAHWLDRASAQTLGFVARRLLAESIAVVFAVRDPGQEEFAGLPEMVVEGLSDGDARALLDTAIRGRLDERVRDRIVAETRGNPLALLELPRAITPAELAGGFGLSDGPRLTSRIEESFLRRLRALPADTQRLLLTAAAEPVGDVALLWRAAERLGIGREAADPARADDLIEFGARVRFRHPLVRSAASRGASSADLRAVHGALAEVTDPTADPDRRAWHRAYAAAGPDEEVAADLERSAGRAQARGGLAAAAAFLERAANLTPDPAVRASRALAAARAKLHAGAPDAAFELIATTDTALLDEVQRGLADVLRARIAFETGRRREPAPLLLKAARRLAPLDPALARETYLDLFGATIVAGRLGGELGVEEAAREALAAPPPPSPPRSLDLLLDGLTRLFTEDRTARVPALEEAIRAGHDRDDMPWVWLACPTAVELWDDEAWHRLATRAVGVVRESGALTVLPIALGYRAGAHIHAGELDAARALLDEADAIATATGKAPLPYVALVLAAWRGADERASEKIAERARDATALGDGRALVLAEYATAVLHNGLGGYETALAAAERASAYDDLGLLGWALAEQVEAGIRSGRPDAAAAAMARLAERTSARGTDWALGIEARSRALLSDGGAAEDLYREAIGRLERTRIAVHLARAHLLYGEWLRRAGRRVDAREQLRTAHGMFSRFGTQAFAERARRELLATGETVRKRNVAALDELTAQEAQIARLAGDGRTNPEIGAELFISPRTVEWHLRNVFSKLGIGSRRELHRALAQRA